MTGLSEWERRLLEVMTEGASITLRRAAFLAGMNENMAAQGATRLAKRGYLWRSSDEVLRLTPDGRRAQQELSLVGKAGH